MIKSVSFQEIILIYVPTCVQVHTCMTDTAERKLQLNLENATIDKFLMYLKTI